MTINKSQWKFIAENGETKTWDELLQEAEQLEASTASSSSACY